ncbi:MAG: nicotinamide-nucleotide adenylyltransferase, partial [Thermodesulfovibrionia bacterium]|nr:nicotinamide-nucleotide adenylyltransferase [Thermodesulfovibrionia bacterium]
LDFSDKVVIAIGSSQEKNTVENPFSFEERKEMIREVLISNNITNYEIIAIPDINDDNKWVGHVKSIVKEFDIVYTGNKKVKALFEEKNISVREVSFLNDINATEIRKRIKNDEDWEILVPIEIVNYLDKISGIQTIKSINGKARK